MENIIAMTVICAKNIHIETEYDWLNAQSETTTHFFQSLNTEQQKV